MQDVENYRIKAERLISMCDSSKVVSDERMILYAAACKDHSIFQNLRIKIRNGEYRNADQVMDALMATAAEHDASTESVDINFNKEFQKYANTRLAHEKSRRSGRNLDNDATGGGQSNYNYRRYGSGSPESKGFRRKRKSYKCGSPNHLSSSPECPSRKNSNQSREVYCVQVCDEMIADGYNRDDVIAEIHLCSALEHVVAQKPDDNDLGNTSESDQQNTSEQHAVGNGFAKDENENENEDENMDENEDENEDEDEWYFEGHIAENHTQDEIGEEHPNFADFEDASVLDEIHIDDQMMTENDTVLRAEGTDQLQNKVGASDGPCQCFLF